MFGFLLTRAASRRCHQAIVWAMVPLAVFNGRTLVACGCTSQLRAACHCQPAAKSECAPAAKTPQCPKCAARNEANHTVAAVDCCSNLDRATSNDDARTIRGHHCRSVAFFELTPGTLASSITADDLAASAAFADSFVLPFVFDELRFVSAPRLDAHPPDDLCVVLHRLII